MKMKNLKRKFLLISILLLPGSATLQLFAAATPFSIVPAPQSIKMTTGMFTFKQGMSICLKGALKSSSQTAGFELAAAISNAFKYQYKITQEISPSQFQEINLFVDEKLYGDTVLKNAKYKEEAYKIGRAHV